MTWSGSRRMPRCPRSCKYHRISQWRIADFVLSLPHSIYSTGGTILSASNYSRTDNINYGRGTPPTPQSLIEKIPELLDIAQLAIVPINASAGSAGLNSSVFLGIAKLANKDLCSAQSDISGALVFHGTNTLEETVSLRLTFHFTPPLCQLCHPHPDFRSRSHCQLLQTRHRYWRHAPGYLALRRWAIQLLWRCGRRHLPQLEGPRCSHRLQ
jgi:hypothetical protein